MTPQTNETERRALLRRLYTRYKYDPAFRHLHALSNPFVPGDGPMSPRLMFIGEAPGKYEAKHRKPFVGASGKLLGEMLESVQMKRAEVFITNVVKFRPPENRDPTPEEAEAGIPYLRREHRLLGRPPMVLLGKHARNTLQGALEGHPVGHWLWFNADGGFPVLPLHHPAFALYQRSNRPMLFKHFRAVLTPPANEHEVARINDSLR